MLLKLRKIEKQFQRSFTDLNSEYTGSKALKDADIRWMIDNMKRILDENRHVNELLQRQDEIIQQLNNEREHFQHVIESISDYEKTDNQSYDEAYYQLKRFTRELLN